MVEEVEKNIIKGGYKENTKDAIVYKGSWEDEKVVRCTVSTLCESARKKKITKTALIVVGDGLEGSEYNRSELYNPFFTTEFRKGIE